MQNWNSPPKIKSVFYDDFSEGIRQNVWRALNECWSSQNNNGYSEENCLCSTNAAEVARVGGTGGIVAIRSNGDYASDPSKKRQGGGIVTKKLFGPGLYEVRMKVVPRAGQCSAIWTYYNNWEKPMAVRKYSEIDLETPHGGDYRYYSGTTYQNYMNAEEKICRSEVIGGEKPLNDGNWHVLAFEWRTASESGDEGLIWYCDGKPVLRLDEAVPHYTATFWIASLFQDAPAWLGVPRFENAYLYVDWVKITEYEDPVQPGAAEKESRLCFTGIDLKDQPLPETEYIANGQFSQPPVVRGFKGTEMCVWELTEGAEIANGKLVLPQGQGAAQTIEAQYDGFIFETEIEASGNVRVYLEYLSGKANQADPELTVIGRSEHFDCCGERKTIKENLQICEKRTEHIRIVLEGVADSEVYRVSMRKRSKEL